MFLFRSGVEAELLLQDGVVLRIIVFAQLDHILLFPALLPCAMVCICAPVSCVRWAMWLLYSTTNCCLVAGNMDENQWDLLLLLHKTGDELGTPGKA